MSIKKYLLGTTLLAASIGNAHSQEGWGPTVVVTPGPKDYSWFFDHIDRPGQDGVIVNKDINLNDLIIEIPPDKYALIPEFLLHLDWKFIEATESLVGRIKISDEYELVIIINSDGKVESVLEIYINSIAFDIVNLPNMTIEELNQTDMQNYFTSILSGDFSPIINNSIIAPPNLPQNLWNLLPAFKQWWNLGWSSSTFYNTLFLPNQTISGLGLKIDLSDGGSLAYLEDESILLALECTGETFYWSKRTGTAPWGGPAPAGYELHVHNNNTGSITHYYMSENSPYPSPNSWPGANDPEVQFHENMIDDILGTDCF